MNDPVTLRTAACISSLLTSLCWSGSGSFTTPLPPTFPDLIKDLSSMTPSLAIQLTDWNRGGVAFCQDWNSQSFLSDQCHLGAICQWERTAPARLRKLRELLASSHGSEWLQITPNYLLGTCFPSAQWQLLLRWRTGTLLAPGVGQCPGCRGCLDPLGDHALSCAALGSYRRHNFLRD